MVVTSSTRYIVRDRDILNGEPIIVGAKVPARDIVALWQDDIRPEDIPAELYNLVSTAQVFDAISFYLDNQSELDEYMERYRRLGVLSRSAILLRRQQPILAGKFQGEGQRVGLVAVEIA